MKRIILSFLVAISAIAQSGPKFPITSGGSSLGPANASGSFTAATSVTITHNLNTLNIVIWCSNAAGAEIPVTSISSQTVNAVTIGFASATGKCVVNGSGGVGVQGPQGPAGTAGADGVDGADGAPGSTTLAGLSDFVHTATNRFVPVFNLGLGQYEGRALTAQDILTGFPWSIAAGGTNATTAAGARTSLGAVGLTDTQTLTNKTLTLPIIGAYTVAGLPAAGTANRVAIVTDSLTIGDVATGGGSAITLARDNGSAWESLGDGGSGGGGGGGDVFLAATNNFTGANNFSGASSTIPFKVGLLASIPATCSTGAIYFASDAAEGTQIYRCISANTWRAGGFVDNGVGCFNFTDPGAVAFVPACLNAATMTWTNKHVHTPSATQVIDAAGDSILANSRNVAIDPDANYTLTAEPVIIAGTHGEFLTICNVDTAFTVTLKDEAVDAGSLIRNGGSNLAIGPRACKDLQYSTSVSAWVVKGGGGSGGTINLASDVTGTLPIANGGTGGTSRITSLAELMDPRFIVSLREEFIGSSQNTLLHLGEAGWNANTNTGLTKPTVTDRDGVYVFTSFNTQTNRNLFLGPAANGTYQFSPLSSGVARLKFGVKLTSVGATTTAVVGCGQSLSTITPDGIYFRLTTAGNWTGISRNAGADNASPPSTAASTSWVDLEIRVSAGSITFWVDGVQMGSAVTATFTGASTCGFVFNDTAVTPGSDIYIDYFRYLREK